MNDQFDQENNRNEGGRPSHKFDRRDPEKRAEHRRRHHEKRNFWADWRDERYHHGRGTNFQVGQALSPKEMEAWKEFFHKTFGTSPEEHWIFGGRRFSPWHQGMDSFNPFIATLLSKGGGLLPLYVLHLISQKPRYGNEIMEMLTEQTKGSWVANPGAIYPLLTLLEKEGFIEGNWEDPEKRSIRIYTITPSGQEEVKRIAMIVIPKLSDTLEMLQTLNTELQQVFLENEDAPEDTEIETDSEGTESI